MDVDLKGALNLVPHLICDGLIVELRERTEREAGIPQDAVDRIDCLAGLRSDVTQLSGELAKIALPQLNSWLEP